jgi:hypothetical protein
LVIIFLAVSAIFIAVSIFFIAVSIFFMPESIVAAAAGAIFGMESIDGASFPLQAATTNTAAITATRFMRLLLERGRNQFRTAFRARTLRCRECNRVEKYVIR